MNITLHIAAVVLMTVAMVRVTVARVRGCGPLQVLQVKNQWEKAYGIGQARDDFGIAVWRSVFAQDPSVRKMFSRVRGDDLYDPEFTAHSSRVFGGLDALISLLDQPDTYHMQVNHLKSIHKQNKVKSNHFGMMKNSLMKVMSATLDYCFDEDAWNACLDFVLMGLGQHQ